MLLSDCGLFVSNTLVNSGSAELAAAIAEPATLVVTKKPGAGIAPSPCFCLLLNFAEDSAENCGLERLDV